MGKVIDTEDHAYSHLSIVVKVNEREFYGIKRMSYSHKLEPGTGRGNSAQVTIRTKGTYDAEAEIELYLEQAQELIDFLGDGYMERSFSITVGHQELNKPLLVDELRGCRIKESSKESDDGSSDPSTKKFPLSVFYLLENGKTPLLNMRQG